MLQTNTPQKCTTAEDAMPLQIRKRWQLTMLIGEITVSENLNHAVNRLETTVNREQFLLPSVNSAVNHFPLACGHMTTENVSTQFDIAE